MTTSLILTRRDHAENYASETLLDGLEANHSLRHLARLAHIYLATRERLTLQDWQENLPRLLQRTFGSLPLDGVDWGWLGKVAGLDGFPKHGLEEELARDLEGTFEATDDSALQLPGASALRKAPRWTKDNVCAFRVFQLLSGSFQGNVFDVCVCGPGGGFQYPFPLSEFPVATQMVLGKWVKQQMLLTAATNTGAAPGAATAQSTVVVPRLFTQLSTVVRLGPQAAIVGSHIALDMSDFVVLRFLLWFCASSARGTPAQQQAAAPGGPPLAKFTIRNVNLAKCSVMDVFLGQPANEILHSWCRVFFPPPSSLDASSSSSSVDAPTGQKVRGAASALGTFVHGIAELWLNYGPNEVVSVRVMHALLIVFSHLHADPRLKTDAQASASEAQLRTNFYASPPSGLTTPLAELRAPLHRFFMTTIANIPQDKLMQVLNLFSAVVQPWKAASRLPPPLPRPTPAAASSSGPSRRRPAAVSASSYSGGAAAATPASFTPEWTWFIIQHYSLYVDGMLQALKRISSETNTEGEALHAMRGLFEGAFASDGVLATLVACEHVLAIGGDSAKWDSAFVSGCLPPTFAQDTAAQRAVEIVRGQCDGVYAALTMESQYLKNGASLNSLLGSSEARDNALNVLKQLSYQQREEAKDTTLLERALFHASSSSSAAAAALAGVERLRVVFRLPDPKQGGLLLGQEVLVKVPNDSSAWPSMETVVGWPPWLRARGGGEGQGLAYARLTHLGVHQIKSGRRTGNPEMAAQYLGDPFLHPSPPLSSEVPALVWAMLAVSRHVNTALLGGKPVVNLRFLADARNLVFGVIIPLAVVDALWFAGWLGFLRVSWLWVLIVASAAALRGPALVGTLLALGGGLVLVVNA